MEDIIYLVHRIPFPPNKGDKIRSYNVLRWLADHYRVHLGCFIDDEEDKQYQDALLEFCETVYCGDLNPFKAKVTSLRALLRNQPLTEPYYYSADLQCWVDETLKNHSIEKALVFSSSMAQYLAGEQYQALLRVIDFVDVDSDKWRMYAEKKAWPMNWIYHREHKTLQKAEHRIAQEFDCSLFVTEDEAKLFRENMASDQASQQANSMMPKVSFLENGVDTHYFDPTVNFDDTHLHLSKHSIVFTGAMDYWANVDAVVWFAEKCWPSIVDAYPQAQFYIVGGKPAPAVVALACQSIVVTGRVPDVRPYLAQADCVVAPLRIARGVQNKVLEAFSMAKPVIATSMAMEGIQWCSQDLCVDIQDDAEAFITAVKSQLDTPRRSDMNRDFVEKCYGWTPKLNLLHHIFADTSPSKCSPNLDNLSPVKQAGAGK